MTQTTQGSRVSTAGLSYLDLGKIFGSAGEELVALQGVTFDVAPGEFVSLVGPSGCGKSTLLKITSGLLAQPGYTDSIGA